MRTAIRIFISGLIVLLSACSKQPTSESSRLEKSKTPSQPAVAKTDASPAASSHQPETQQQDEKPGLIQKLQSLGKFQPDEKFLNSPVLLREGVMDLGGMTVNQFVDMISKAGRSDGAPAELKGWTKDGNTYILHAEMDEPLDIEFDFNGVASQLQPVKTKRRIIDPWDFTMQLDQNRQVAAAREAEKIRALKSAQEDFENFRTNSLAAGAKLINDEIIAKKLDVDLLSRDGRFDIDPIKGKRSVEDFGTFGKVEYRSTVFANATEDSLSHACSSMDWDRKSVSAIEIRNVTHGFFHFPRQIEDESVKKAFAKLYQEFDERLRRDAGEDVVRELPVSIRFKGDEEGLISQQNSALEKFDYKNEGQVEGYQQLLSKFQKEMGELRDLKAQQTTVTAKISRKQAVCDTPKENLPQALQQEIKQTFADKRLALEASLKALEESAK
jgi:hypothetical protein